GGYGVIRHIQDKLYDGNHVYDKPLGPDFEALAALARMPFKRVNSADALGPTVADALAIDGPVLVEVDMTAIGTFPPYFAPPPFMAKQEAG
ncbi:MAG: thiamine pyrophosphate-dependent enzyme, partial [Alphaproteobacteria bacterium]|nr:thiamine pyrophosphate-dependent enzyme [Alphaproteobacteria bacterium]